MKLEKIKDNKQTTLLEEDEVDIVSDDVIAALDAAAADPGEIYYTFEDFWNSLGLK